MELFRKGCIPAFFIEKKKVIVGVLVKKRTFDFKELTNQLGTKWLYLLTV